MLASIGEAPTASLYTPTADIAAAVGTLNEVSSEVQAVGWHCNTDTIKMAPDTNGFITVGPDVSDVRVSKMDALAATPRDGIVGPYLGPDVTIRIDSSDNVRKLWDKGGTTFVFNGAVTCEVIREFDFDALTTALKSYIKSLATVRYQRRVMGSDSIDKHLENELVENYAKLLDAEEQSENTNAIRNNPEIAWGRYHYQSPYGLT